MQNSPDLRIWLSLSQDERSRLAAKFGLRKSSATSVVNNNIVSDGHTPDDLKALSIGVLIGYLDDDLSWFKEAQLENLLQLTLNKLYGRKPQQIGKPEGGGKEEADKQETKEEDIEKPKSTGKGRVSKKKISLPKAS